MNIIAAINSGRPFKTPKMKDYIYVDDTELFRWLSDKNLISGFIASDITGNAWELLPASNVLTFPNKFTSGPKPTGPRSA